MTNQTDKPGRISFADEEAGGARIKVVGVGGGGSLGGLAEGGVARVGQVQLSQPVLTLLWSALLLGERIGLLTMLCALLVLGSVAVGQRTRVKDGARGGKAAPAKKLREG